MGNIKAVKRDLIKFSRDSRLKSDIIFRKIIIDLFGRVVLDTPVDTGAARGNWYPNMSTPASGTRKRLDKTGSKALAEVNALAQGAELGKTAWLTNNLPYILRIENDGWSKVKAPDGMVKINVVVVQAIYGGVIV